MAVILQGDISKCISLKENIDENFTGFVVKGPVDKMSQWPIGLVYGLCFNFSSNYSLD